LEFNRICPVIGRTRPSDFVILPEKVTVTRPGSWGVRQEVAQSASAWV